MPAVVVGNNLTGALKRLKRLYESDVRPSVRRHKHAESPGQRRRLKARRARTREAKRTAREAEA